MNGVRFPLMTTYHITKFSPWKRVNSKLQPYGRSRTTKHTHSCALSAAVILIGGHITSYTILLQQESLLVVIVFFSIIRSKPPICTTWMA